jgi:hypothetical protein
MLPGLRVRQVSWESSTRLLGLDAARLRRERPPGRDFDCVTHVACRLCHKAQRVPAWLVGGLLLVQQVPWQMLTGAGNTQFVIGCYY